MYDAYAEALLELASRCSFISTIKLIFVGPNCPSENKHEVRMIHTSKDEPEDEDNLSACTKKRKRPSDKSCKVVLQTYCSTYDKNASKKLPKPDIVVFFNPGFTCPDYKWAEALDVCLKQDSSRRIPFLATTNTEMEGVSDLQYLHQNGYIDDLPAMVADIVNDGVGEHDADIVDYNDKHAMFFGENPNSGSRVRQSGNMANDLFVKNRWIYGGLFSSPNEQSDEGGNGKTKKDKRESSQTKSKTKAKNSALM